MTTIEHATYTTSLPREFFLSPDVLEKEFDAVFSRQWLYFGHVSQLKNPGDFLAREILSENIIAVRTGDGDIRAHLNVCRHRGARLCTPGEGVLPRGRITCPYHQWSYGTDGELMTAPTIRNGDSMEYSDFGLHKVQLEVWQGFIFVGLGEEPLPPLAAAAREWEPKVARCTPEKMKEVHVIDYEIKANWKIVLENGTECYHCAAGHPELTRIVDIHGDAYLESPGSTTVVEHVTEGQRAPTHITFYGEAQQPLRPGLESFSMDGSYACKKLLGEFGDGVEPPAGFTTGLYVHPSFSVVLFYADHCLAFEVRPISPDRTQLITRWFVHEDAVEGVDYDIDNLIKIFDVTNEQDAYLCELVQTGIRSRRYRPGPLSDREEPIVRAVLNAYLDLMGVEA